MWPSQASIPTSNSEKSTTFLYALLVAYVYGSLRGLKLGWINKMLFGDLKNKVYCSSLTYDKHIVSRIFFYHKAIEYYNDFEYIEK